MKNTEVELKVLWIDDEWKSNPEFMDVAMNMNINITPVSYLNKGLEELKNQQKHWDAVILDCNCKMESDNEVPDFSTFRNAIDEIKEIDKDLKWFPYTAGEGFVGSDSIEKQLGKSPWLERRVFYKTRKNDAKDMFKLIRDCVKTSDIYKVREQYKDVISIMKDDYKGLLNSLYERSQDIDAYNKDIEAPHNLRERVICPLYRRFEQLGLLRKGKFVGTNLNDCFKILDNYNDEIIPKHIRRALAFIGEYAQEGSHDITDVSKAITTQANSYLNSSALETTIMVIAWSKVLETEEMSKLIKKFNLFEGKEGVIEKDSKGNYHIDNCIINKQALLNFDWDILIGHNAIACNPTKNANNTSNKIYKYYSKHVKLL